MGLGGGRMVPVLVLVLVGVVGGLNVRDKAFYYHVQILRYLWCDIQIGSDALWLLHTAR